MKVSKTIPKVKFVLGKDVTIEKGAIIGYSRLSKLREGYSSKPVVIGDNTLIRAGAIIYAGCVIGKHCHIGHNAVLREFTTIGDNSSIGSGVVCEGYTTIGHHTTIHAQTHLTAKMTIGDYIFIGPNCTTMNDKRIRYYRSNIKDSEDLGPIIEDGVAIGGGAIIFPKVKIYVGCIIGAGSLVTKDCNEFMVYYGSPVKKIRHVEKEEVVDSLQIAYRNFINKLYQKDRDGWE